MPKAPTVPTTLADTKRSPVTTEAATQPAKPNGKPSGKKGKKKAPEATARKVLYDHIACMVCVNDSTLTDEQAKKLMGWEVETDEVKFTPDEILLKDTEGRNVRCTNNPSNRPFYFSSVCLPLKQEILNGKWSINCENRIIGSTGLVLNGQHTFSALILACEEWEKNPDKYPNWKERPTLDTLIAFGCPEDDRTVNTMDTCKPRSLMDVLYRSEMFRDLKKHDRILAAKRLADAIKMLWHRTGASMDAFRPKRTHSESIFFVERHKKLVNCVAHIQEENGDDNRISRYLPVGYAAALMFLMGSAKSDRENEDGTGYFQVPDPSEHALDWSLWDEASKFWVLLAAGNTVMDPIREALGQLYEGEGNGGTIEEKLALICKAWITWSETGGITPGDLMLEYEFDGENNRKLVELPVCGGVDIGKPVV